MGFSRSAARRHLDAQIEPLRSVGAPARPVRGWIRAIRDALGMSSSELARRMGTSQQAVPEMERSEVHDTIKLATLRRVADALECDLVYALVPRATLDATVETQARRRAVEHLDAIAHHSRLEDQTVADADVEAQLDELAAQFVDRRGLWTTPAR
jgi:predicted DNA-binding mobile mystery protein A